MDVNYLTKEHLEGFEKYKYSAIDTNPLSKYILHPFWNWAVELVPRWIAPNLLTFSGFMCTVIGFVVISYYDYYYLASSDHYPQYAPIPSWVWLFITVTHFLAYTLDGIDGKQARRTGTSGPLGELFDHGLDSWSNFFITVTLYSIFGSGDYSISTIRYYFIVFSVHCTFLSSHWEKYNTGILYLPWGYDFSEIVLTVCYFVTWLVGYHIWKVQLPYIGVTPAFIMELTLYAGSFVVSLPVSLYNVYASYRDRTGKMRSFYEATRPIVSFLILYFLTTWWAIVSPSDILVKDPRCFYLFVGTVFSIICTRLIIAQMTDTRCELINWTIPSLMVLIPLVIFVPAISVHEVAILRLATVFVLLAHSHYGYNVVRQMCSHFDINCFSIKKKATQ